MRDLNDHLRDRGIDLPGHDGGSRRERGKLDLHKPGSGAGTHDPQIFREFRERAGDFLHDA